MRYWSFCAMMKAGFKPIDCPSCTVENVNACEERLFNACAQSEPELAKMLNRAPFHAVTATEDDTRGAPASTANDVEAMARPSFELEPHFQELNARAASGYKLCVLSVIGTRPEAVKMGPLLRALNKASWAHSVVVFSGQHVDLIKPFLLEFDISVDVRLQHIMVHGQSLSLLTARLFEGLDSVLDHLKGKTHSYPDLILVQGDTTSAMVGGAVGFYRGIPVGHVEAGLRTYNLRAPMPEEFNRQLIAVTGTYSFAPTKPGQGPPHCRGRAPGSRAADWQHGH